jgi:hypothetical protein
VKKPQIAEKQTHAGSLETAVAFDGLKWVLGILSMN